MRWNGEKKNYIVRGLCDLEESIDDKYINHAHEIILITPSCRAMTVPPPCHPGDPDHPLNDYDGSVTEMLRLLRGEDCE